MDLRLDVPGLSGNVEKDVKNLSNYVFQLSEELRYLLYNLDVTNFNDLGLARYENGRLQIYTEKLQATVGEIEVKIKGVDDAFESKFKASAEVFEAEFLAKKYLSQDDADGTYLREDEFESSFKASAEAFEASFLAKKYLSQDSAEGTYLKQENFESSLNANAEKFVATFIANKYLTEETADGIYVRDENFQGKFDLSAVGLKTEFSKTYLSQDDASKTYVASSTFEQTAETVETMVTKIGEDGSVLKSDIKLEIRNDESLIKLIANSVEIDGVLTIGDVEDVLVDGKTVISGDNILTGTIRAASYVASGDIDKKGSYAFSVEDGYENTIGWIGYQLADEGGSENDYGIFSDKLWLRTDAYEAGSEFFPSIKLSAAGRISMEALGHDHSAVYIAAPYYITLDAYKGTGDSKGVIIRDNDGYEWTFKNGHLYLDGDKML